jgi:phospholipid/cholesterol/gamma-HCH transport system permease protein
MAGVLESFGKYALLMRRVFSRPEKKRIYYPLITEEMMKIGVQSVGIVALLAFFMGAVVALQTALVLAGKVGSNIASEIGTMRISEQIDALDIMGVNSASYLILPKLIAALFILPFLVLLAMFIGIGAGALIAVLTNIVSLTDFIYGIQYDFQIYGVIYSLIKTLFFAFILTTIPAFHGYYANGGALEVGKSSTKGVVYSMVAVMVANYILTQLLLL